MFFLKYNFRFLLQTIRFGIEVYYKLRERVLFFDIDIYIQTTFLIFHVIRRTIDFFVFFMHCGKIERSCVTFI